MDADVLEKLASVHSELVAVDATEDFKVGISCKVWIKQKVYTG